MASQFTGVSIVCSTVCSGADQRKHQSSVSLAFVRGTTSDRWIPLTIPRDLSKRSCKLTWSLVVTLHTQWIIARSLRCSRYRWDKNKMIMIISIMMIMIITMIMMLILIIMILIIIILIMIMPMTMTMTITIIIIIIIMMMMMVMMMMRRRRMRRRMMRRRRRRIIIITLFDFLCLISSALTPPMSSRFHNTAVCPRTPTETKLGNLQLGAPLHHWE